MKTTPLQVPFNAYPTPFQENGLTTDLKRRKSEGEAEENTRTIKIALSQSQESAIYI